MTILLLLTLTMLAQDPVLTEGSVDAFLRTQVAAAQADLPQPDVEGNVMTGVSLSGRTVTHDWSAPSPLDPPAIARLDRALLSGCEDPVIQAAAALGVRLRHVYRHGEAAPRVLELAADTCGGVRLSSSRRWRTIQATATRLQAVDMRSVVEDGEFLTFEFVGARPPTAQAPEQAFEIYGYRLDCAGRTFAVQYVEAFDREGQSLMMDDQPRPAGPINPRTVMAAVAGALCESASSSDNDGTIDPLLRSAWERFDASGA